MIKKMRCVLTALFPPPQLVSYEDGDAVCVFWEFGER